ncbi:MAG TPA: efflux RND transporter periplasmic adaptor subunit [Candidatus Obscuribacterales bacterium]
MPRKPEGEAAGTGEKKKAGATRVTTAKAVLADLPIKVDAIGNVEALESVSVQPQISGQLRQVHFTQGAYVHQGQLLFELDARLQTAAVTQTGALLARDRAAIQQARANLARSSTQTTVAEANLKRDRAQLKFAATEVARYKKLLEKGYVALEEVEKFQNTLNAAEATLVADQAAVVNARAQVQADQAALQTALLNLNANQAGVATAKIQLGFTRIFAPISGKTGPLLINAGNNVQANSSILVNIKKLSPIFVSFSAPEKLLPAFQHALATTGVAVTVDPHAVEAKAGADAKVHQQTGQLVFIDNTVNKNNGTVFLKARFGNGDGGLWPGQFVKLTAQLGIQRQVLSIPAAAVQKGPTGDFVYVIRKQKAQTQAVTVDRISQGTAVILKGLHRNQEVIVTGQQALTPDMPVQVATPGKQK